MLLSALVSPRVASQSSIAKVCECDKSSQIAAINFDDGDCETPPKPTVSETVTYSLVTSKPEVQQIAGYMCSRWVKSHRISTFFFNKKVITTDHYPIDTSADACVVMKTRRTCVTEPMGYADGKWSYTRETSGVWMQDIEHQEVHCLLDGAHLQLIEEEGTVSTPIGKINSTLKIDGCELVRYSPCYSTLGFVNVNEKPYVHRNETWELMDIQENPRERPDYSRLQVQRCAI